MVAKNSAAPVSRAKACSATSLPFLEGTIVRTRYGAVSTENILFIAAGAFNMSKPSDLIPELQGRLPIRVELDSLTASDFRRILTEPKDALIAQYKALLGTEGVTLSSNPRPSMPSRRSPTN